MSSKALMSSVRLSVTLVDRLEILETNCTDNWPITFALCSPKAIHLIPGEHGVILGRLGGVVRSGVLHWSTKVTMEGL